MENWCIAGDTSEAREMLRKNVRFVKVRISIVL